MMFVDYYNEFVAKEEKSKKVLVTKSEASEEVNAEINSPLIISGG